MNNTVDKNPEVITIPNPIDLDATIQRIQTSLSVVTWLTKIFGRAKILRNTVDDVPRLEPMVYQGTSEYYSVMPNDALDAYCFFRVWGNRQILEHEPGSTFNKGVSEVDLIFWANLQQIDSTKGYIFTEELINETFTVLNNGYGLTVSDIIDEKVEDIFRGYTLSPVHRDLMYYPYQAWRFQMELDYELNC